MQLPAAAPQVAPIATVPAETQRRDVSGCGTQASPASHPLCGMTSQVAGGVHTPTLNVAVAEPYGRHV